MVGLLQTLIGWVAKYGCKIICKIFTSELGFKSGIMRGFQKGITLGGRTPGSVHKVPGGGGGGWWPVGF